MNFEFQNAHIIIHTGILIHQNLKLNLLFSHSAVD